MRGRWRAGSLALALGLGWSAAAQAGTGCFISDVTGADFGSYDSLSSTPTTTAGAINLCCEDVAAELFVTVDVSLGSSSQGSQRSLSHGGDSLLYNLYMNAGYTQVWGDGFNGTSHYGPLHPDSNQCTSIAAYGKMPALQAVPAGTYSDTLTVTLSF